MKIRNGFVSNSSSSSFLVVFDKTPESVEELYNMMFPIECVVQCSTDEAMDSHEIAEYIYNLIQVRKIKMKPIQKHEFFQFVDMGWFPGYPNSTDFHKKSSSIALEYHTKFKHSILDKKADKEWVEKFKKVSQKEEEEYKQVRKEKLQEFVNNKWDIFKNKVCCSINLSDNENNEEAFLEHNDIFRNLPHITVNHH